MEDNTDGFHLPQAFPELPEAKESGMGLVIMRKFMDTLAYKKKCAPGGVNTLIMTRNLTIRPQYA
jgi:anti-sigma regulatory factor (Ser/Thr protein kinase)